MKRNKIMALAMLCSTLLSPVLKAQGGTKQDTQESSDSSKNLKNTKNKKSDNPQEMYNSRWKTSDIVKYIEYVLGTIVIGGGLGYGGKKVYNKYIRNSKFELKESEIVKFKIEPKKVELTVELTKNSIAKKIKERLDSYISEGSPSSKIMRKVYKKVVEDYKIKKVDKFQKIIKTEIPNEKQDDEQFITWFQELNNDALDILLEGFSDKEKQFAKENFKFYSFVWVYDEVNFVIAFAPKEKEINLEGKKGEAVCNFDDEQLFDDNFNCEYYNKILKHCEIDK